MQGQSRRLATVVGILALLAASSRTTLADSVSASTAVGAAGINITIHSQWNGSTGIKILGGSNTVNTNGEQFATTFYTANAFKATNSPFRTFCVDLARALVNSQKIDAFVSITGASDSSITDGNGNARNIGAAGWVVNHFGNASLATLQGMVAGLTAAEANTGLQMAVWEAAYAPTSTAVNTAGSALWFTDNSGNSASFNRAVSLANQLLQLKGTQSEATGMVNYPPPGIGVNNQDMLFAVPEPSTVLVAGLGGLGFAAYGMRRRHAARPAFA